TPSRDIAVQARFAHLRAHPERHCGAGHRSRGGEQRDEPAERTVMRGRNDDRSVDAEGQIEEDRGVKRREHEDAERRCERADDPGDNRPQRVAAPPLERAAMWGPLMRNDETALWRTGRLECVMVSCCSGAELQV